jgi:hypothetical protein
VIELEKPCQRCKIVTITDEDSKLCYDCWVDLDIIDTELEYEHVRDKTYTRNMTGMDDDDSV